ncbi:MAG: hypothetical protein UR96_C0002G0001 [candidate division WS6 bacterium GW2011_GWC1_36_11]|uniref:Uncharacterized protein n=1 Tax=candidate division WS6 bacterium GW2011_GWC1_36_11 TaxID=1619090 RepID=A0A0G0GMX8_9BACT|nr:MAG: hypothetical protein UR96_C0002G0001 [candidate division WS6 bacterium GW2011_GWC1_36_11]KKQ04432.1 MAG: hypothetical protein US14_C0011G0009 [candidate division WS6 bacterium GW2011_WS6_36_26]
MKKMMLFVLLVLFVLTFVMSACTPTANCGEPGPNGLSLCSRIITPTANCGEPGPSGLSLCSRRID